MILPRAACKFWDIDVAATLANGLSTNIVGVDFTLVLPGAPSPGALAVWLPSTYVNGIASILIAGPEHPSPPVGALVVASVGGDLYGRVLDTPEEDIKLADMIRLV